MVKFKVTCSIADISTLKMCCTWERKEVASFLCFIEGIINSFPSVKSLYSKKGAEQDPTRTKCLQWITPSLCTHCHLTQQDTGPTALNAWGNATAHPRAGCGPQPGEKWKIILSLSARWDGHCQTHAMLWEDTGQEATVPLCWAPVLGINLHTRNVGGTEGQAERERRTE